MRFDRIISEFTTDPDGYQGISPNAIIDNPMHRMQFGKGHVVRLERNHYGSMDQ